MEGFYLLCGHLLGDYIFQPDYIAANKTNSYPRGDRPGTAWTDNVGGGGVIPGTPEDAAAWDMQTRKGLEGTATCLVHCVLYTLAIWLMSWWWLPVSVLPGCFITHYVIDRNRLAKQWMLLVGQKEFATGPLSPWSVVVVDNTMHLLTLAVLVALFR